MSLSVTCSAVKKSRQSRVKIIRACTSRTNWLNCHVKQKQKVETNTSHSTTLWGKKAHKCKTMFNSNHQTYKTLALSSELIQWECIYHMSGKQLRVHAERTYWENKYVLGRLNISHMRLQLLTSVSYFIKLFHKSNKQSDIYHNVLSRIFSVLLVIFSCFINLPNE